eukprot:TRINITY_DN1148_c1_g1_i2.p1 TRINITY_DN1148_c1_g1~~TRINITY_DN1148_c1_g1_i2.p1  ORF type:complete len:291 (-),score=49.13 TRINITY_DN1148_c1_g1_i2:212-1084(-)
MTGQVENHTMMERFQANYDYLFIELRDPRVDNWLFMSSPWPVLGLCAVYYYVIRVAGPRFMKDRPPYDIKNIMIAYNFFQTFLSLWIFSKACRFWLAGKYNLLCQPVDYSYSEDGWAAADMTWWYFFSKFIDYFDSIFFVLRKKFSHLSTLHVVHHGIMPFTAWWGIKFVGGGHTTFCGFLNMGVHVVMYFYYLMSAMGPEVQKYLWWKRYLTTLQLGQFVTFFVHASLPLFIECDFPKIFSYVILFHGGMFFLLFANFYIQSYVKKGGKSSKSVESKTDINANAALKKD